MSKMTACPSIRNTVTAQRITEDGDYEECACVFRERYRIMAMKVAADNASPRT